MRFHFGNPNAIRTIADAVPLHGGGEFESPTRSTIPLLSLLIHARKQFDQIITSLGMPDDSDLHLEYTVPPPRGQGNASHTDVMLRSGGDALAIEAKWTEPVSETVEKWLSRGKSRANREAVLKGWLRLLEARLERSFDPLDFHEVNYQMLHRAASAAASGSHPRLAYLLFSMKSVNQATCSNEVFEKLRRFWVKLGRPDQFPFHVVEINIQATPAYEDHLGKKKGDPATSKAVVAALRGAGPLFEFHPQRPRSAAEEIQS